LSWFLYLILLTETNDIGQALVGRRFGKHKISPRISPNKSAEGLVGGVLLTAIVAMGLAPSLTTFFEKSNYATGFLLALASGILISLIGYLGDINMSGAKRDAGVKDGSRLFPGMGGMIDRIDSLTFTAPAFYFFLIALGPYTHRAA
jgi:phosphatidate cytidylyltransferase